MEEDTRDPSCFRQSFSLVHSVSGLHVCSRVGIYPCSCDSSGTWVTMPLTRIRIRQSALRFLAHTVLCTHAKNACMTRQDLLSRFHGEWTLERRPPATAAPGGFLPAAGTGGRGLSGCRVVLTQDVLPKRKQAIAFPPHSPTPIGLMHCPA